MKRPAGLDWPTLIAFGLGRLRLTPEAFWALSPRELAAMAPTEAAAIVNPLERSRFEALAARFPDGAAKPRDCA